MSGSTRTSESRDGEISVMLESDKQFQRWQNKLLPFMTRMLAALTLFFFIASFVQLIYLHWNIRTAPSLDLPEPLLPLPASDLTTQQVIETGKLKALIMLEKHSLERQYHQANVLLMARVWTSYLGFVTGMVLALVGAAFILGKLREPVSELSTAVQSAAVSLKSASPGLVLAVLGTMLMLATIVTHHKIEVVDKAVYLYDSSGITRPDQIYATPNPLSQTGETATPGKPSPKVSQEQPGSGVAAPQSSAKPTLHRPPAATGTTPTQQPSMPRATPKPEVTP